MTTGKGKSIAILQSNYIPWKGYFDIMAAVDEFVIYDEVQFTRRDWRNRNKIVQHGQVHWLTIPVLTRGSFHMAIDQVRIADPNWSQKHWTTLRHAYSKAPYFELVGPVLEDIYRRAGECQLLTEVNEILLRGIATLLGITTPMSRSQSVPRKSDSPTARLVEICLARNARDYLSGPAAQAYIDQQQFDAVGIRLFYADYSGYQEYSQGTAQFDHGVSIVDLLMRCGPAAINHLKSSHAREKFCRPS